MNNNINNSMRNASHITPWKAKQGEDHPAAGLTSSSGLDWTSRYHEDWHKTDINSKNF